MTQNKDLAPVVEQIILPEEQLRLQDILTKFNQLVPANFVQLTTKGRNHMCSTLGWKEPVCERYIFFQQDQPKQIDILHTLMEKLELEQGKNISYPVYLAPSVLTKELSFGAINIEHEQEIFIQKPLTIENLEKELEKITNYETKLSHYKLSLLTSLVKNVHKSQVIKDLLHRLATIRIKEFNLSKERSQLITERNNLQTNLTTSNETNASLTTQITNLTNQITQLNTEKNKLNTQLVTLTTERNDLTNQVATLTTERDGRPNITNSEYNALVQERNTWQNNYNQLLRNISNLLLPETTIRTVATTNTLLLQQAREVMARLLSERQVKEQMITERNNRPNITLALWNSDYSVRPTKQQLTKIQQELVNTQQELNNPILSIIRYLLNGKKKSDFIKLIELAKNSSLYQNKYEVKTTIDLMSTDRNYNSTGNLAQLIASFLEDLEVYRVMQGYKVLTWKAGNKPTGFYYDAGPTDRNTGWRTRDLDYNEQTVDEEKDINSGLLNYFFEDPTGKGKKVEEIYIDFGSDRDRSDLLRPFLSEFKNFPNLKKMVWNNPYLTDTIYLPDGQTRSGSSWTWTR